jgi:hypothetical protein
VTDLQNYGLGYRRIMSAAADFAVSATYNKTEQTRVSLNPFAPGESTGTLEGPQLELQQVWRTSRVSWVCGAGAFRGDVKLGSGPAELQGDDEFTNGYAYARINGLGPLEISVGASYDDVVAPSGLLTPRDSQTGAAEIEYTDSQVSPKLGATLQLGGTTLRAAGFYRLSSAIGRVQTLEPTQVAGFNQFFFEPGGTRSLSYGAGIDQDFGRHLFGGLSVLKRDAKVPEAGCDAPTEFTRCAGQVATHIERLDSHDLLGSGYLNAAIGNRLAMSVGYAYEERKFDTTVFDNQGILEEQVRTQRARPEIRYFFRFGLFAGAGASWYDQRIERNDDQNPVLTDDFWIADALIGYRFPKRLGAIVLEGRNLTDREFEFYQRSVEETLIPARQITLTGTFTY